MSILARLLTRRDFVRTSALFGLFGLFTGVRRQSRPRTDATAFFPLRRGTGYFTGRGGTIGWMIDPDALVVVDTQMPDTAQACLEGLAERSPRRIDLLVNSHHHHDHTGGNGVFRPAARRMLAHENVPPLQKAAAERANRTAEEVYATETYSTEWAENVGGETLRLRYRGPAHTGGDSIIHFVKADVVHTGDLVFNRIAPFVDTQGGSSVSNWIDILEWMHGEFSDGTIFIFGHGSESKGVTGNRSDLLAMRDFLGALLAYTDTGLREGKTTEELAAISALKGFEEYSEGGMLERFRNGIRQTCAQRLAP